MRLLAACLVALAVTGCAASTSITTSSTAPSPPSSTSGITIPPVDPYTVDGCSSAQARPWSILCRAHELVTTHHIDVPEAASLAAAAAAGVRAVDGAGGTTKAPAETVACVIPDVAYVALCEEISDRHRIEGIPLDILVEGAVQGLFRFGLDPFSSYLTADYAERIDALGSEPPWVR